MYSKILVPIDGSDTSLRGLNEAVQLAKVHGSALCLMHVINEFVLDYAYAPGPYSDNLVEAMRRGGQEILDAAEKTVLSQGIKPTCVMVETIGGVAADMILDQATKWHADLIVMGTHGRRGILRLAMGSDAEQVVRAATVPVLLIRSQSASKKLASAPVHASAA
jgi:nucleotide-binding universal stress UspA family protein